MSKGINLTSSEWTDIVFEGRNKEYGAYAMRQSASKRHIYAILIVTTFFVFVTFLPTLLKVILPSTHVEKYDESTVLTTVDMTEKVKPDAPAAPPKQVIPRHTITFTPPEITEEPIDESHQLKSQTELNETRAMISQTTMEGSDSPTAVSITDVTQPKATEENTSPIVFAEQMPQFPGGDKALISFISQNLRYPTIAAESSIQGRVTIRFVVSKTGEVTDVQILRGIDPACDKEAYE